MIRQMPGKLKTNSGNRYDISIPNKQQSFYLPLIHLNAV